MNQCEFGTELAVEGLDERVIRRLARPREVDGKVIRICPEIKIAGNELAALLDANGVRAADLSADPLQSLDRVLRAVAESWIYEGRVLREDIDHGQNPDLLAHRQLVVDEVHSPVLAWPQHRCKSRSNNTSLKRPICLAAPEQNYGS